MFVHAGRSGLKLLPVFLAVVGRQYASVGVPGAAMILGGGGLATPFVAAVCYAETAGLARDGVAGSSEPRPG